MTLQTWENMTVECECEHESHFHGKAHRKVHQYGELIPLDFATEVHTIFGKFTVCVDCARTCLKSGELKND